MNLAKYTQEKPKVSSVVFSRDSHTIASVSSESAIIIWDLRQILTLEPLISGCNWVRDYLQTNLEMEESDRINICPLAHR
ncbi:MAG: hypothetical protein V7K57_27995 [Nostoc sp.]|uniref:hypothetical protein n=1 Tax=Nostoc sp. TaxID=1180 RepID=UPI002FF726EC